MASPTPLDHNESSISVSVRVRPMSKTESGPASEQCTIASPERKTISFTDDPKRHFTFDGVFSGDTEQTTIYDHTALPLLHSFCMGLNSVLLCIGPHNGGKTHTLFGPSVEHGDDISSLSSHGPSEIRPEKIMRFPPAPPNATPPILVKETAGPLIDDGTGVVPRLLRSLFDEVPTLELRLDDVVEAKAGVVSHANEKKKEQVIMASHLAEALSFLDGGYENRSGLMVLTIRHCATELRVFECDDVHFPLRNKVLKSAMEEKDVRISIICTISPSQFQRETSKRCLEFGHCIRTGGVEGVLRGSHDDVWNLMHSILEEDESDAGGGGSRGSGSGSGKNMRENLQGAARRMETDLAVAREELTNVGSLLKSAAQSMDRGGGGGGGSSRAFSIDLLRKELGSVEQELDLSGHRSLSDNLAKQSTSGTAMQKRSSWRSTSKGGPGGDGVGAMKRHSSRNSLSYTVAQIELDLENTRKELMGVGVDVDEILGTNDDEKKDHNTLISQMRKDISSFRQPPPPPSSSSPNTQIRSYADLSKQNEKDKVIERLQKELATLRNQNKSLLKSKRKKDDELTQTKLSLKRLLNDQKTPLLTPPTPYPHSTHPHLPPPPTPTPIQVHMRLRPMSPFETSRRSRSCITLTSSSSFTVNSPLDGEYDFKFDRVFNSEQSQSAIFDAIGVPIVGDLMRGVNCCVMAHGVPGSGKTTTLFGSGDVQGGEVGKGSGLLPRIVAGLFGRMESGKKTLEYALECSFLGVFLEKIIDLLHPDDDESLIPGEGLLAGGSGGIGSGVSRACCFRMGDVLDALERGRATQSVLCTKFRTSRFFSFFYLTLTCRDRSRRGEGSLTRATLTLVDMAGFESKPKQATSQEVKMMNKCFQTLFAVIRGLNESLEDASTMTGTTATGTATTPATSIPTITAPVDLPYRDSKLTELLKDALGGNCKTHLFITASASSYNISETLSTIKLGQRFRKVVNLPRINKELNLDQYKRWLLESEVKLGELCAFVKDMVLFVDDATLKEKDKSLLASIRAIIKDEDVENNPCRRSLCLGDTKTKSENISSTNTDDDKTNPKNLKWRELTTLLLPHLPSPQLESIIRERNRAESLLADRQSEVVVLRRQNELLSKEKKRCEEELVHSKKEVEMLTLEKSEVEHERGLSLFREREAVVFLRYIRRLCWRLQRDISKSKSTNINEITATISGAPDLSGLVDLDSILLERKLIEKRHDDDEDDEEDEIAIEKDRKHFHEMLDGLRRQNEKYATALSSNNLNSDNNENNTPGAAAATATDSDPPNVIATEASSSPTNGTSPAENPISSNESTSIPFPSQDDDPDETSNRILVAPPQNRFANWFSTRKTYTEPSPPPPPPPPPPSHSRRNCTQQTSQLILTPERHEQLEHDLRILTRKCIDLQIALDDERKNTEIIVNRHGSLRGKRLAQEVLELRKERDKMMHNAKAATWKLQELYVVNKVLDRKSQDERRQVTFLEEGFQKLQDKFRATVLKSMEGEKELREKMVALEKVVESLTVMSHRRKEGGGDGQKKQGAGGREDLIDGVKLNLCLRGVTEDEEDNLEVVADRRRRRRSDGEGVSLHGGILGEGKGRVVKVRRKDKFEVRGIVEKKEMFKRRKDLATLMAG